MTYQKAILLVLAIIISFAFGRYSVKQIDKVEDVEEHKDTRIVTVIIEKPSGEKVTTVTEETNTDTTIHTDLKINKRSTFNVSGLIGTDAFHNFQPIYGISVSKELIGPITIGAYGMTNGIVGLSVGINF